LSRALAVEVVQQVVGCLFDLAVIADTGIEAGKAG
jgi:hypothetical protein